MSSVLVTGGSGYLGSQLITALLRSGRSVRATVRSPARERELRAAVRRGGADDTGLRVVVAELTSDDGWGAATADCDEVHHVASPPAARASSSPDDLITPARLGSLRVLRAARDAGARRVVLTSSFAAVGYTPNLSNVYTEADWTDPESDIAPYPRSKTIAELSAWEFMEREGGDTELVVVNPTYILGPTLLTQLGSTYQLIETLLSGRMTLAPRRRFGVVDVRDVVDLHIRAMAKPNARNKRFLAVANGPTLSYLKIAEVLRGHLGPLAARGNLERRFPASSYLR